MKVPLYFVDVDENCGIGETAVTLNATERQNYERLFKDAVIQFKNLCIGENIGEGEKYTYVLMQ